MRCILFLITLSVALACNQMEGYLLAQPAGSPKEQFTVRSSDEFYNSPIIGNGEVVTTVGPTGYHNGYCIPEEKVNRTIFWAGRRLRDARSTRIRIPRVPPEELIGPTRPLIRFGRLDRTLTIDGKKTSDTNWEQTLDCDRGMVISKLNHTKILETTRSLVCLTDNIIVFHTQLKNLNSKVVVLDFRLDYEFGDAERQRSSDTRLHIRRPHPEDLSFGNVEGIRSLENNLENRPTHLRENLQVFYDVNDKLGEVRIGRYPLGSIEHTDVGGIFEHKISLEPGKTTDLWFWVMLSDRFKYSYFPEFEQVKELLDEHQQGWADFWNRSVLKIGNAKLEALRQACLYDIRCNTSPWYSAPGYLSTVWEGRTLHDEFYPYMALLSGGHLELAARTPNNRLRTLPVALRRGGGHGAYFAWESTEEGEDSAPYGHWTDERFIAAIFSEEAWRYYLHTRDKKALTRYYPVIRNCAEWLIYDVLRRNRSGKLETRLITDANETVFPLRNSTFLLSAIARALQNAAHAARALEIDQADQSRWLNIAHEVRDLLPTDDRGYRYVAEATISLHPHNLSMVFPFSFDVNGGVARKTASSIFTDIKAEELKLSWLWTVGRLATSFFYQGRPDEGFAVLSEGPNCVGPFLAPNEQMRPEKGAFLAWYTVGAGAFVHAMNAMFVQVVDEGSALILPAIPKSLADVTFEGLLASHGVLVSGELKSGKIVHLSAATEVPLDWRFRIPKKYSTEGDFVSHVQLAQPDTLGFVEAGIRLEPGINYLIE